MNNKKAKEYLSSVQDALKIEKDLCGRPVIASDEMRDFGSQAKNNAAVARQFSSVGDEAPRKHADGSVCKAASSETCPFNKKAEKGDHLDAEAYKGANELNKAQLQATRERLDLAREAMSAVQRIMVEIGRRSDPRIEKCFAMLEAAKKEQEEYI